VGVKDPAQENREHVRRLLQRKQPEFAALPDCPDLNSPCLSGRDAMCAVPVTNWYS
jgi:hypothetical protein